MPRPAESQIPLLTGDLPAHSTKSNAVVRKQRLDLEERDKRIQLAPNMIYVQHPFQLAECALGTELSDQITLDVETRGKYWLTGEIVSIQIYASYYQKAYFIPIGMTHAEYNFSREEIRMALSGVLENRSIAKIGHELKYDIQHMHKNFGIEVGNFAHDTLTASRICNENEPHDLEALCVKYCKVRPWKIAHGGLPFELWPINVAIEYGCLDVINEYKLWEFQTKQLSRKMYRKLRDLIYKVEFPNVRIAARMERRGIGFDSEYFSDVVAPTVRKNIEDTREQIFLLAGKEFDLNPDAPAQIAKVIFDDMGLPRINGDHVDHAVLTQLQQLGYRVATAILDNRRWNTVDKMFVRQLPKWVFNGRIHTTCNTTGTDTGRWTNYDPNLQQIPKKIGPLIRRAFIPSPGYIFVTFDYDQGELRMMAHLADDPNMIAAFHSGMDFHAAVLCQVFCVEPDYYEAHKSDPQLVAKRTDTKAINFGTMYGMGYNSLAVRIGREPAEAKMFQKQWFDQFPRVQRYVLYMPELADKQGYVETILGRRRRIPDMKSTDRRKYAEARRAAVNSPIQGSVADLVKMTMNAHDAMIAEHEWPFYPLLNEHDEILYEVPLEWIERNRGSLDSLKSAMENIYPLKVPLKASMELLSRWGDKTQLETEEDVYASV